MLHCLSTNNSSALCRRRRMSQNAEMLHFKFSAACIHKIRECSFKALMVTAPNLNKLLDT